MDKTYEKSRIAVDAVIFTIHERKLKVLLHSREKEPFMDHLELLGGLIRVNETAKEALKRKLDTLFDSRKVYFTQFHTFTDPKRDPRERAISIGYIALVSKDKIVDYYNWHDVKNIQSLAFDHKKIINYAKDFMKNNIDSLISKQFLPSLFPLNELQDAYEAILEEKLDNRNFRKRMISSGMVEETKHSEKSVSHRPAKLYKFKSSKESF